MLTTQIVNRSSYSFHVTLFMRYGNDPLNDAGVRSFLLKSGKTEEVTVGGSGKMYLNGIGINYFTEDSSINLEQKVTNAGSTFDKILNENQVLIISDPFDGKGHFVSPG